MKTLKHSENASKANVPADYSEHSQLVQPLPTPKPASDDSGIVEFVRLVTAGVQNWLDAGRLLLKMQRTDEDVFHKIIARCEWLTIDSLATFARVGRMELRPEVLLLNHHVQGKMLKLGYSQQSKLLDSRVPVVVEIKPNGEPLTQQKKATELTRNDLALLITGGKIRTASEQLTVLRDKRVESTHKTVIAPLLVQNQEEKKLMFLGMYRIVVRGGKPELEQCEAITPSAQRILFCKDDAGDMAAIVELTKWSDA